MADVHDDDDIEDEEEGLSGTAADELRGIKWILVIILILFLFTGVAAVTGIFRIAESLETLVVSETAVSFEDRASDLLDRNKLEALRDLADRRVKDYPNDENGHWYLALAHYQLGEWAAALEEFGAVRRLAPSWDERFIKPYEVIALERLSEAKEASEGENPSAEPSHD